MTVLLPAPLLNGADVGIEIIHIKLSCLVRISGGLVYDGGNVDTVAIRLKSQLHHLGLGKRWGLSTLNFLIC